MKTESSEKQERHVTLLPSDTTVKLNIMKGFSRRAVRVRLNPKKGTGLSVAGKAKKEEQCINP